MIRSFRGLQRIQLSVALLGLLFLSYLAVSAASRSRQHTKSVLSEGSSREPVPASGVRLQDFSRVQIKEGKKSWEIKAQDAQFVAAENITHVTSPVITFPREGKEPVIVHAERARLFMAGENVERAELEGSVKVELGTGTIVYSDFAVYESETDQIEAPGKVLISGEGYETRGDGLELNIRTEEVYLLRDVSSKFNRGAKVPSGIEVKGRR